MIIIIVHGLWPETGYYDLVQNIISHKRISQGHQNGSSFSFILPSSEE